MSVRASVRMYTALRVVGLGCVCVSGHAQVCALAFVWVAVLPCACVPVWTRGRARFFIRVATRGCLQKASAVCISMCGTGGAFPSVMVRSLKTGLCPSLLIASLCLVQCLAALSLNTHKWNVREHVPRVPVERISTSSVVPATELSRRRRGAPSGPN